MAAAMRRLGLTLAWSGLDAEAPQVSQEHSLYLCADTFPSTAPVPKFGFYQQ